MAARTSGQLAELVAFDVKVVTADDLGGERVTWSEAFRCRAEFRYQKGGESVQAGGLIGQATFKVRIPASSGALALTSEHRMRDARRGTVYNIVEPPDAITDRQNVWLVVTSGVAV